MTASGHPHNKRDTLAITVPATTPKGASDVVDPGFMAFGISMHSFQDYAGNLSSPNTFSRNLIETVSNRTGSPVHIRVGGTSGDYSIYKPDQTTPLQFPPEYTPGQLRVPRGITFGPSWSEGFENFHGVQWTHTAHMANNTEGMLDNSIAGFKESMKHIGSNLEAIEIGNEINFYNAEGARPSNYLVPDYVQDWNTYSGAIQDRLLKGTQYADKSMLQALGYYGNNCPWCVVNTFEKGMNKDGKVKSVSLHAYMTMARNLDRQRDLMNHTRVAQVLDGFKAPLTYLKTNQPNIPLHLAEVNSATYHVESVRGVVGVFGSALWLCDWLLYGASMNIARMNVQQSTSFPYSSWRPVEYEGKPAAVLPPYYAHPFFADAVGKDGDVMIASMKLNTALFSAYGVYDASSGSLKRVVLINLLDWPSTNTAARPSTQVTLTSGNTYAGNVKVERLTAPNSDLQDSSKITWKGTSWTYESNGMPVEGKSDTTNVKAAKGKFAVNVKASEAVLLTLQ